MLDSRAWLRSGSPPAGAIRARTRTSPRASSPSPPTPRSRPSQKLAKRSTLAITVRNDENRKTIPNVAVTVNGFDTRIKQQGVADPTRPVFVINGRPKSIGTFPETKEDGPVGGETAYVNTWALGKLGPGKTKTFKWNVTAVRPGPYKITYRVAAGLNGKAQAVSVVGDNPVDGRVRGHDLRRGAADARRR